jgi:hypothetical protein
MGAHCDKVGAPTACTFHVGPSIGQGNTLLGLYFFAIFSKKGLQSALRNAFFLTWLICATIVGLLVLIREDQLLTVRKEFICTTTMTYFRKRFETEGKFN